MTIIEMLETPEKYIPHGDYCYYNDANCPFWELKSGEYPPQEDGYCHYLHESDWDYNERSEAKIVYAKNPDLVGTQVNDVFDHEIDPISGKKTHFPISLLFDQVKSCNVNMDDYDDTIIIQYDSNTGEKKEITAGDLKKANNV